MMGGICMSDLRKILADFREKAATVRDQGTSFEKLMIAYFQAEPYYKTLYSKVLTYAEWVEEYGQRYGISSKQDTGVDLVAVTAADEQFHAIQCKNYEEYYAIQKGDIDSFLATSGKIYFEHRIIITTTIAPWSKNAEDALINQNPPVIKITLHDLEKSFIDWSKYREGSKLEQKSHKDILEHQKNAIDAVVEGLKFADRGKLIMACGTGKTFTSLKIAETLAGKGKRVLFLVPSIALLNQTLREWSQEAKIPLKSFAVCSDSTVGKKDSGFIKIYDLAYPATTNASSLGKKMALQHSDEAMTVVFSTYHSIDVISNAQYRSENPIIDFDLVICDEAHRTTGFTYEGEDDSAFVRVHNNDYISAKKRLYMTATPRIYGEGAKNREDVALYSMDDPAWYGKTLHTLNFSDAVERNLLVDYKVIILTVDEGHVNRAVQPLLADTSNTIQVDTAAKIVGCWKALSKYGLSEQNASFSKPMQRAVAFCQIIEEKPNKVSSKLIARHFQKVIEDYQEQERQNFLSENPEAEISSALSMICEAKHVDGSMTARDKEERLEWLREPIPENENRCRILSNVRCLSEGVDVPALDAVIFLTPRSSEVDVVQAVGRVMRKASGKQRGYVILPIVVKVGADPDKTLKDSSYKIVWQVLRALRSHDDRFDATINKIEFNGHAQDKIEVVAVTNNINKKNVPCRNELDYGYFSEHEVISSLKQGELDLYMEGVERAIYAKIVEKCGNKRYWEDWAKDIAKIAGTHIDRINAILENKENIEEISVFNDFAEELRAVINDSITDAEIVEMLAQHLITKPVFDALFEKHEFTNHNPISVAMQRVIDKLSEHGLEKERNSLQAFYTSVKRRAEGVDTAEGKQKIIVELYDKFFRSAFPKMVERLGIVYTPTEVVDFVLHSVEHILKTELNSSLADDDIHTLDPFTGTGTFITRLLQSDIIPRNKLPQKYKRELHINEIVLLAYYIATINIETTYHVLCSKASSNQNGGNVAGSIAYEPFNGACLTDTFLPDGKGDLIGKVLVENSARLKRQHDLPIVVIVGNPPYSIGQRSENDGNQNIKYPELDTRIEKTYVKNSSATSQRSLYDSYIRAFRWASDRIKDCGVIGFVTNAGFVDSCSMDGFRKCLRDEFSSLYIVHLRGNCNTSGEKRKKEGGNIFDSGSRAPIAVSILVKKPEARQQGKIYFKDIGDYLSRQQKLEFLAQRKSIAAIEGWVEIVPDQFNDWINQRDPHFDKYISIGDKKDKSAITVFENYSQGVVTSRDAWCYNFFQKKLRDNMGRMIDFYNSEVERVKENNLPVSMSIFHQFVSQDPTKISWSRAIKQNLLKKIQHQYDRSKEIKSIYRPFTKEMLYFDKNFNEMQYQMPKIFPDGAGENLTIVTTGKGASQGFSALMVNMVSDIQMIQNGQCFPLYLYEQVEYSGQLSLVSGTGERAGYQRRDAITDKALQHFKEAYPKEALTKEDIFYYIYGLLHSEDYRERYADNLAKQIARIPRVKHFADFVAFMQAGRALASLHLNYETVPLYTKVKFISKLEGLELTEQQIIGGNDADFYVREMKFAKKKDPEDGKSVKDRSTVIYNSKITIENIPKTAYEYIVNGKSALEWVVDRQAITTDKASMITNNANDWAIEVMGNARYPLELFLRIITVSLETCKIVNNLPKLKVGEEG